MSSSCIPHVQPGLLHLRKPLASLQTDDVNKHPPHLHDHPEQQRIHPSTTSSSSNGSSDGGSSSSSQVQGEGPSITTSSSSSGGSSASSSVATEDRLHFERQERELGQEQEHGQEQDQRVISAAALARNSRGPSSVSSSSTMDSSSREEQGADPAAAAARTGSSTVSCAQEVVHVSDVATAFAAVLEEGLMQQPVAVYVIGPGQPPSGRSSKLLQACESFGLLETEVRLASLALTACLLHVAMIV